MYAFGDLLRQFRIREGIDQQTLADELNVHRQTIGAWERSQYLPKTREKVEELAKALYLNEEDTDALLVAADFPLKYQTKMAKSVPPEPITPMGGSVEEQRQASPRQHPEKISISRLPETGSHLFGRDRQLQQLDEVWADPAINIISLVAWGGIGKSTLINHWLMEMSQDGYRNAKRVFAWSFYRQGVTDLVVSSDLFIDFALRWFDDPAPNRGSSWEKGERLARLVKEHRNLVIIDGLEPLQYPPGPREGKLKDPALTAFLRELAAYNAGLCVISTRLTIADLSQFEVSTCPRLDLKSLSSQAGADLLRSQGVKGKYEELEQTSTEFEGHSLALTLLGSYLRDAYNGDIGQRNKISLLQEDVYEGGHAGRVMSSYEKWFGEGSELGILRLLGLFDRPADEQVIAALRFGQAISNLTDTFKNLSESDWQRALARLRRAKLISERDPIQPGTLDAHPLVREYFGQQLQRKYPEAWREGNSTLYEYYKSAAEQLPVTIEEMEPLFLAMIYGCKAGRHHDTLQEVYLPRIMRGDEFYAVNNLGALSALLSVLSHFFVAGDWGRLSGNLDHGDRLVVLTEAGRYLTEVKGYAVSEVGQCYTQAEQLCDPEKDSHRLFEVLLGLCRFYRLRGELRKSGRLANNVHSLYQRLGEPQLFPAAYRALATNLYYTGDFEQCDEYAKKGLVDYSDTKQALNSAQLDVNEPGLSCLGYISLASWFRGYPDQARETALSTLSLAQKLGHAHTLAITLLIVTMIHQFRQDEAATKESAEKLINFCSEQGFTLWRISGEILYTWALAKIGSQQEHRVERMKEHITGWQDTEAKLFTPYWFGLLAEIYFEEGQAEEGLRSVTQGLALAEMNGERWWNAELYNLRGKLLLTRLEPSTKAGQYFSKAVEVAHRQGARSLELRATINLARWEERERKSENAREMLASLYGWFQEGFDTRDLKEASQLLQLNGGV